MSNEAINFGRYTVISSTRMIDQLTYTSAYVSGYFPPRHLPPAIRVNVEMQLERTKKRVTAVAWYKLLLCPGCGKHVVDSLVAVVETDPVEAKFNCIPVNEYVNERQLREAAELYAFIQLQKGKVS